MSKQREIWVDSVKIFACILVVLGHLFQSMNMSGVFSENFVFIEWFIDTVYLFHVPLFFICSGYLHQKNSKISNLKEYSDNLLKKLVSLGIPYFFFSVVTWLIKNIFSDSVNIKNDGLFYSLFLKPISPYWYLYALFFIFLITPVFKSEKTAAIGLIVSLTLKLISFVPVEKGIYAVEIVLINHIWFVIGMCLCKFIPLIKINKKHFALCFAFSAVFIVSSIMLYIKDIETEIALFAAGLFGCAATVGIAFAFNEKQVSFKIVKMFSKYTLPVYLMHTIFAAGVRIVLIKLGITSAIIHVALGLAASFIGPMAATEIMSHFKFTDFFLYPGKYIKINKRTEVKQCLKN